MSFDFDAAVTSPFRMQPGLRRLAAGARQLTPLAPGSRHQREKMAVLSSFAAESLLARDGFDSRPALHALYAFASVEHPQIWRWDGRRAEATSLGVAVDADGCVRQLSAGAFGLGDEISRCLAPLQAVWRQPALLLLAFAEDFAIVDAADGTVPWLGVTLPSFWAPGEKIGRHFAQVHAPVADNALLLKAAGALVSTIAGPDRWERFVWTVTPHPRLHAHPVHVDPARWASVPRAELLHRAWFRSERQTFIAVPEARQAIFTIAVDVQPLLEVAAESTRARMLHAALASMSPAVLEYRGLTAARETLLDGLAALALQPR